MAVVNVDYSEYNSILDGKSKAEEKVRELESKIDGLKNNSSCFYVTKFKRKEFDVSNLFRYLENSTLHYSTARYAAGICAEAYENAGEYTLKGEKVEVCGFNDVRNRVEEILNKEYKAKLEEKIKYCDSVEERKNDEIRILERDKKELKEKVSELKERIDELNAENEKLKEDKNREIEELRSKFTEIIKVFGECESDDEIRLRELNIEPYKVEKEKRKWYNFLKK